MKFKEYDFKGQKYLVSVLLIWIFGIFALSMSIYAFSFNPSGVNKYYSECSSEKCFNIFYNNSNYCGGEIPFDDPLCTNMFVFEGFPLGSPPPFIIKYFMEIFILAFVLCALCNHFLYNKEFKFGSLDG